MLKKLIIIPGMAILFSCVESTVNESSEDKLIPENKTSLTLKASSQFTDKTLLTLEDANPKIGKLDSSYLKKWTDNYVPFVYGQDRHYSANLYSIQPSTTEHCLLAVYSQADHWEKIHLLSLNKEQELVDHIEVANSLTTLDDQTETTEVIGHNKKFTRHINGDEYIVYNLLTSELIDYQNDKTSFQVDSVVSKITLDKSGRFKEVQLDSIRKSYAP